MKWVEYLGSAACQDVVASKAVVFPAIKASTDKAVEAFKAKGMDVTAVHPAREGQAPRSCSPSRTTPPRFDGIMKPAMDAVMSGKARPAPSPRPTTRSTPSSK